MMKNPSRTVFFDLFVCLIFTEVLAQFVPNALPFGDATLYDAMAAHPTVFTYGHWGFRLLTPWLVHLIPLSNSTAFDLITTLALTGTAAALAALCRSAGLKRRSQLAASFLFLISFPSVFMLYDSHLVDPLTYLGTVLMFLCLALNRPGLAGLCIFLTTFNKEWGIFLIAPFVVWLLVERILRLRAPKLGECILGINLPLAAFFLIRFWPNFGAGERPDSFVNVVQDFKENLVGNPFVAASGALGALPWIAPFGWSRSPLAIRLTLVLIPLVLLQWIDAGTNSVDEWPWDPLRMMGYAFPAAILLTVVALDQLSVSSWIIAIFICVFSTLTPLFPALVRIPRSDMPFGARCVWLLYAYIRDRNGPDLYQWTYGDLHFYLSIWLELLVMVLIYAAARNSKTPGRPTEKIRSPSSLW